MEDNPDMKLSTKEKALAAIAYPVAKLGELKAWFLRKKRKYRTIFILRADGRVEEFLVKPKLGEAHIKVRDMVKTVKPDGWFVHKKLGPIAIYSEYSPDPITRDNIKVEGAITGQLLNSLLIEYYQLGKSVAADEYMKEIKKLIFVNIALGAIVLYLVWQGNSQITTALKSLAQAIQHQSQVLQSLKP